MITAKMNVPQPSLMLTMNVSPEEVANISSQMPLDVLMSRMMHYDPIQQVLHYGVEVRDLVEKADRAVKRERVPDTVTLLQARLEMIERGIDAEGCIKSLYEPERSVLAAVWSFSATLRRDDERVGKILTYSGITDVGEFFIRAAKRK